MKKLLSMFAALALVLTLVGCSKDEKPTEPVDPKPSEKTYELALVTDKGTIDDKSFNQGAWEGLEKYAKENNLTHKYYQPQGQTTPEYLAAIELAIKGGAKVVVCPGFLFEGAVYEAQTKYPDVKFVFVDGTPKDPKGNEVIAENTVSIMFDEEEAGFLAGYAAVKEGYKNLGYFGGVAVPAVIKFGIGYVQGADYAAKELGLTDVSMKYYYCGDFVPKPEFQTVASSWYSTGTEVIFASAGGAGSSVFAAAETAGKAAIGVDVDQSGDSSSVITSATKGIQVSVYDTIKSAYDGTWSGGEVHTFGLTENGVALVMDNAKFENFTQEDYDAIIAKVVSGEVKIENDTTKEPTEYAKNIKVDYIK